MSLARAFTKRRDKRAAAAAVDVAAANNTDADSPTIPQTPLRASLSVRDAGKMINRKQISAPVALLSTTNMLSYNAPDIATYRQQLQQQASTVRQVSSSSSSTHSNATGDESDTSSISNQTKDSLSTDLSSVADSPIEQLSPEPEQNHLSQYFPSTKTVRRSVSASEMRTSASLESPAIPKRAPSHSKRAHEASSARKRSQQAWEHRESITSAASSTNSIVPSLQPSNTTMHSRNTSNQSSRSQPNLRSSQSFRDSSRSSIDVFRTNIDPNHPFGKELEQLNEVAEEFVDTVRDAEWEADASLMKQRGLARFCANDYLVEISPLFAGPSLYAPLVSTDGGFF